MSVLGQEQEQYVSSAYQQAAEIARRAANEALNVEEERGRPFMLLRPRMYPDGNQWCALYGENIQEGVCGFGETPEKAAYDFDKSWHSQKLMAQQDTRVADLLKKISEPCNGFEALNER